LHQHQAVIVCAGAIGKELSRTFTAKHCETHAQNVKFVFKFLGNAVMYPVHTKNYKRRSVEYHLCCVSKTTHVLLPITSKYINQFLITIFGRNVTEIGSNQG